MEFHEKLQLLRQQKGLTQEELAQALYVSRTAVSKWESGRGYPNIDSLKAIAAYFAVTVDDLLSCDEVLTIAEDEQKQKSAQLGDMLFGLLDISTVLLFVLPCFRQTVEGALQEVSLLQLTAVTAYTRAGYVMMAMLCIVIGVLLLVLQRCQWLLWVQSKRLLSLTVMGLSTLLLILGTQPYAAALLFVFLIIQVILLLKER